MDLNLAIGLLSAVVNVLLIIAIFRIFSIDATLKKLLEAVKKADARRREEFDAMTEAAQ